MIQPTALATPPSQRGLLTRIALVCAMLGALLSVAALTAPAANADTCDLCGGTNGSGSTGTSTPGLPGQPGQDPPEGDGLGGSGGGMTNGAFAWFDVVWAPAKPPGTIPNAGFFDQSWDLDNSISRSYAGKCEGKHTWQDGNITRSADWLGTKWSLSGYHTPPYMDPENGFEIPDKYTATAGGYECIPPPEYKVYSWTCVIKGQATWHGPMNNGYGIPAKTVKEDPIFTKFAKTGRDDPALCADPADFNFTVNGLDDWGQYNLKGATTLQRCEYTAYTTINLKTGKREKNTLDCSGGATWTVNPVDDKLELFCQSPYRHKGVFHTGHNFTAQDCKTPNGIPVTGEYTWTCGPTPTPELDGREGPSFEILDDGKPGTLRWRQPEPSGSLRHPVSKKMEEVGAKKVRLALGSKSSPVRDGESANGSRQPYIVDSDPNPKSEDPSVDMWRSGWHQAQASSSNYTGWEVSFMAPGVADKPWTVAPTWSFEADFLTKRVSGFVMDPDTGEWEVTLEDYWYRATETCSGDPADISVFRARSNHG